MDFARDGKVGRRTVLSGALGAGLVAASGISVVGCSPAEAEPLTVGGLAVT